jgi:hypothetical protein
MLSTYARPSAPAATDPACRLCGARLHRTLLDLGIQPMANRTLAPWETDDTPHPLHVRICDTCTLVQVDQPRITAATPAFVSPEITRERTVPQATMPFGPINTSPQPDRYAETMRKRLHLNTDSLVIQVGADNEATIRNFQNTAIPVMEISPRSAFNTETAMQVAVRQGRADLVMATDVLQHAPDLFDFATGLASILRPNGVLGLQVPYLVSLVQNLRFDAFQHQTCTYLSLKVLEHVLRSVGLRVFDAEALPNHGGPFAARPGLKTMRQAERHAELDQRDFYTGFAQRVAASRADTQDFLRTRQEAGRRVAAYGATPNGGMLLNCCGITNQQIARVGDPDPNKHGHRLPGSRIPIVPLQTLLDEPPDDILVLPGCAPAEVATYMPALRQRGTLLWTATPRIARV